MINNEKKEYEVPTLKMTMLADRGDFLEQSGEKTLTDRFNDDYGFSFS